ncbi:MAG: hypothetical protein K6G69_06070 [Lachnospiraceae bacterium]|nr:hypothetical protein [Lachnospiraceae bacterium]
MRNIGKIKETVLNRSVIKPIEQYKAGLERGASTGSDCAFFSHSAIAVSQVAYKDSRACEHAIVQACNNVWAGSARPQVITLSISMPDSYREIRLKEIMKQACETAVKLDVKIAAGHTEYVGGITYPVITVNAIGEPRGEQRESKPADIVMTKWAAISGTAIIAQENRKKLETRLPRYYVEDAIELGQFTSVAPEAAIASEAKGTIAMHDVAGGGIFTALWELGEKLGMGCRVMLEDIPIRQESIEVCEYFDINPYRLRGDGSMLIVTDDPEGLTERLHSENIHAKVIGQMTNCIDRVVIRGDETRFLEPANGDELMSVMW